MKKIRYAPTRRKKALFLCALCLLLFAANVFLSDYGFTPRSAVKDTEEYYGVYGLEKIVPLEKLPLKGTSGFEHSLMISGDTLMHVGMRFNPFMGWFRDSAALVDCINDIPAHPTYHSISSRKDKGKLYTIFFGRIDDENITKAEISIVPGWVEDYVPDPEYEYISTEEFITVGDYRYFYIENIYEFENRDYFEIVSAAFYNADGELVYETTIPGNVSTSMG